MVTHGTYEVSISISRNRTNRNRFEIKSLSSNIKIFKHGFKAIFKTEEFIMQS